MASVWIGIEVWRSRHSEAGQPPGSSGVAARRGLVREQVNRISDALVNLAAGPADIPRFFVLEVDERRGIFAQFLRTETGIWAEIVSSQFLAPWHRLTPDQEGMLIEHGWLAPDEVSPNFHREFVITPPVKHLRGYAMLVLDTLMHVYGVHESDPITIEFRDG
ncbi:TY-Chap domain-containing protein [Actinoplanes subglobosus]|uniref:TY-Chap N-terminal domain-containing protein n=1 Tax=Actinoplanes subglobosus TaxID=1547892 RepID=A0ABV8J6W1_9ACTN